MFVDASAIVAIVTDEPDAESLACVLDGARLAITSPLAIFEAVLGVCRKKRRDVADGHRAVADFLATARVGTVPITGEMAAAALEAFARYGKGRGHPAQLNMGDCFAYAVAKTQGVPLLFKGDDFGRTDITPAN